MQLCVTEVPRARSAAGGQHRKSLSPPTPQEGAAQQDSSRPRSCQGTRKTALARRQGKWLCREQGGREDPGDSSRNQEGLCSHDGPCGRRDTQEAVAGWTGPTRPIPGQRRHVREQGSAPHEGDRLWELGDRSGLVLPKGQTGCGSRHDVGLPEGGSGSAETCDICLP